MGWDSGTVKRELKNLQWTRTPSGGWKKSGVLVEFSDLAFHFDAVRGLSAEERDYLKNFLHDRVRRRERGELRDLRRVFRSFAAVARADCARAAEEGDEAASDKLKGFVAEYFKEGAKPGEEEEEEEEPKPAEVDPSEECR